MVRSPAKRARTTTTTVKLSPSLNVRVLSTARKRSTTKSTVIRDALEAYCPAENEAQAQPGSFLEVAREFAGCLAGPADLSFNKKHLERYGR